ncbi:DUF7504 family protein [Methanooceanicella nereidis]|nr:ATPase domain-containing protein [Methanocella sp. CWC-04]
MNISERVTQEFGSVPEPDISLVIANPYIYKQSSIEILKYFVNVKKMPGVYVTVNMPYESVRQSLADAGIDTRMIIFVDAITKTVGGNVDKVNGCFFLNRINDLTDMAVAISNAIQAISTDNKFIMLDSVSTLLIYNNNTSVSKFIHFLTGKMRMWKMNGILLSLSTVNDTDFLSQLTLFCDRRIELDN